MDWTLRFDGDCFRFRNREANCRRLLRDEDCASFADWTGRYERAVRAQNQGELISIGRQLFEWLEADGWGAHLISGTGAIGLDIVVNEELDAASRTFLDIPWELLAKPAGSFIAEDAMRHYCVQRRLGEASTPVAPRFRDLAVMFMAAAPRDVPDILHFEAEEAGILEATARLPLALTVEESGCTAILKDRLAGEGPFDIVHLTCHGEIGKQGPELALEDERGYLAPTTAAELSDALVGDKPGLLFLSACRTAENDAMAAPFAVQLLRAGVPAVLGWDGSVGDIDASYFARELYGGLARHLPLTLAVASARRRLLTENRADALKGQHWHLARLYLLPVGGGKLCERNAEVRPKHRGLAYNTFLDKDRQRVPVAEASSFVGRRRALQDVFRTFHNSGTRGVLIHGLGGHGKSSLAARIADRCSRHKTALVFKDYDAQNVFEAALTAVTGEELVTLRDMWSKRIAHNPYVLKDALKAILFGPCCIYVSDGGRIVQQPLLLVIDDLERILEKPTAGSGTKASVKPQYRPVLLSVLEAFAERGRATNSRLVLTSRFDFTLKNASGDDLAEQLMRAHLGPFDESERQKHQNAAMRSDAGGRALDEANITKREVLLARCRVCAEGNPLVLATLTRAALTEPKSAEAALAQLEDYKANCTTPDEGQLADVFHRLAFGSYRSALSEDEAAAFRALTLFNQPVPKSVGQRAVKLLAHEATNVALMRLTSLGFLDEYESYAQGNKVEVWKHETTDAAIARSCNSGSFEKRRQTSIGDKTEILANALVRPHFTPLTDAEQRTLAKAVLPWLVTAWTDTNGDLPNDPRSLEVFRLAVVAGDAEVQGNAAHHGGRWLFEAQHNAREALKMVLVVRQTQSGTHHDIDWSAMLELGIEVADHLGEITLLEELLAEAQCLEGVDAHGYARLQLHKADRLVQKGELDEALRILKKEALPALVRHDDIPSRAVAMGKIADILFQCDSLDEALHIRQYEQLPIYDQLGDLRSRAVAMGKIADILFRRGEFDEALRILKEEALPAFTRLGDIRARAVMLGKIADVHFQRGEFDKALRIHEDKRLPVAQELNDVDSLAHILIVASRIRMAKNSDNPEIQNRVLRDLTQAYDLAKRLSRLDFICGAAEDLAKIHMEAGAADQAFPLLIEARDGYWKLKSLRQVARVDALLTQMNHSIGGASGGE